MLYLNYLQKYQILWSGSVSFSSDGSEVDDGFKIIINCIGKLIILLE